MNHKAHMIAGLASGSAIGLFLLNYENQEQALIGGVACFLGSEFPDLDTGSIPSRIAARAGVLSALALVYLNLSFYAALIGILYMIIKSQPHRGLTHSYALPVICFILSVFVFPQYAIMISCFGVGLIVHLIVDRRNPLSPFSWIPA